jgi:hypothetical protein
MASMSQTKDKEKQNWIKKQDPTMYCLQQTHFTENINK